MSAGALQNFIVKANWLLSSWCHPPKIIYFLYAISQVLQFDAEPWKKSQLVSRIVSEFHKPEEDN